MANKRTALIAIVSALFLAGCAGSFRSDVSSFHRLQQPSGESVAIVAKDPDKKGSIEFAQYASMVGEELWKIGYRPVSAGKAPDLIVRIDYGIDDTRTAVRSYGYDYGYGGYGDYGHHGHFGHHGAYGYGYPGGRSDIRSYPVYTRRLEMEIAGAKVPDANLFESKVISEGRSNRLHEVMPLMVQSMFSEFPGPSGVTREVKIDLERGSSY